MYPAVGEFTRRTWELSNSMSNCVYSSTTLNARQCPEAAMGPRSCTRHARHLERLRGQEPLHSVQVEHELVIQR